MELSPLHNWIPYKLLHQEQVLAQWLFLGDQQFTDPFFTDTVLRCKSLPENSAPYKVVSSLHWMLEAAAGINPIPVSGFIFHVSRCGSTLLAQLLSENPEHVVLSEAPLLDEILRPQFSSKVFLHNQEAYFKAALALTGQQRNTTQQHLFIKLDCWHLFFYQRLREWFPGVPFFFLFREPGPVLKSHQKLRGMHMVQGGIESALLGIDASGIFRMNLDDYSALVLEKYFKQLLAIKAKNDPSSFFLDYTDGIGRQMEVISRSSGIVLSEADKARIADRSRFHSKFPGEVFSEQPMADSLPKSLYRALELYTQLT